MPTLNKDLEPIPNESSNNLDNLSKTSTLPKTNRKYNSDLSTGSLPRSAKPRMQTVLESQQLDLDLDQDKPPLPPKPSPSYSKFIISPQPFRRGCEETGAGGAGGARMTLFAGNTPYRGTTQPTNMSTIASSPPQEG